MWTRGQRVLERLATALETVKPQLDDKFGPQTGPAAAAAFEKVAGNVRDQAAEMQRASGALTTAADALDDAQTTHHRLGNAPASPPADASQRSGETAEAFHLRQRDVTASQHHYAAEAAQRERDSQVAVHTVDTKYDHAIKVMESIHGRPARPGQGSGSGGGGEVPRGSVPGPSSTTGAPTGPAWHPTTGGHDTPGGTHDDGHQHGHVPGGPTDPGGTDEPPTYDDPGVPQGPGYDPGSPPQSPGGVPFVPAGSPQLGPVATSPALGGLLSGGILGGTSGLTNGLSNTIRTSAMATLTAEEQAARSASRTTGASAAVAARGGTVAMTGSGRGTGAGAGAGAGAIAAGSGIVARAPSSSRTPRTGWTTTRRRQACSSSATPARLPCGSTDQPSDRSTLGSVRR